MNTLKVQDTMQEEQVATNKANIQQLSRRNLLRESWHRRTRASGYGLPTH